MDIPMLNISRTGRKDFPRPTEQFLEDKKIHISTVFDIQKNINTATVFSSYVMSKITDISREESDNT